MRWSRGACGKRGFLVGIADKAVGRRDISYIAGCLFRVVVLCAPALHGRDGRWLVNEKGAVAAAGRLPSAPVDFIGRAHGTLTSVGSTSEELSNVLRAAASLLDDVRAACTS